MTASTLLTQPQLGEGLIDGLTMAEYLAIDALSHSASRKLRDPYVPAVYRWEKDHPRESTDAMDFGSAVHQFVLGDPEDRIVEVTSGSTWQGKEAKAARIEARAAGKIPLLSKTLDEARAVASAVASNERARELFSDGKPEQVIRWTDEKTGVACKARLDWTPNKRKGRARFVDLKTAAAADQSAWSKSAADLGYHTQADWYLSGLRALGLADEHATFEFVVVAKTPPYLVGFYSFDFEDMEIASYLNHQARQTYAECIRTDTWPGLPQQTVEAPLPGYYRANHDAAFEMEIRA